MAESLRERALRLLAHREHARAELARKLAPHAESAEELNVLLGELCKSHLLSDERYVEMRVNARRSRYGNARLAQELRTVGIDAGLIKETLPSADDELSRAVHIWKQKFGGFNNDFDEAERARRVNFLTRRGFSGETIRRVLRGEHDD